MTIEWTPAMWSDSLLGMRVKIEGLGGSFYGALTSMEVGAHVLRTEYNGLVEIGAPGSWSVFTEKVPPIVTPTEPGWYWDNAGDPWQVEAGGTPLKQEWAPYTRIRSEAEVAAEVLAKVDAEERGSWNGILPGLAKVAKEYGVTL